MSSLYDPSIEINLTPTRLERFFQILPGFLTWSFFIGIVLLSIFAPVAAAYSIIAYDIFWLLKALGMTRRAIQGYSKLHKLEKLDWRTNLELLDQQGLEKAINITKSTLNKPNIHNKRGVKVYLKQLLNASKSDVTILKPSELLNVVIIAVYNEDFSVVKTTMEGVEHSNYDIKQIAVFIAYEERGGEKTARDMEKLVEIYKQKNVFRHITAIRHPQGIPGEVKGKGANINYAGREALKYVQSQKIDPENVLVTTLDADNKPSKNYFAYLSFVYAIAPDRKYKSYQPVPMFINNIWDAPAPMRIIATGNSFWMLVHTMRPHLLRNFSAHAQPLSALIDTGFWSGKTIVEDGHQYWRTYFTYNGKHKVIPLYTSVFQDAVLSEGYIRTFRAQFVQLRRWAWGASDIAYVMSQSIKRKQIPWFKKLPKFLRLFEGHFSWATAPLILAFVAFIPGFGPGSDQSIVVHLLPIVASRIQMIATIGVLVTIFLSLLMLPPRPKRYKPHRNLLLIAQWALLPITSILFSSFAAINAQTRLMLGKYLDNFDVTEKFRRTEDES